MHRERGLCRIRGKTSFLQAMQYIADDFYLHSGRAITAKRFVVAWQHEERKNGVI